MIRRTRRRRVIAAALALCGATGATAQTFPQRPITLIVPYAAGGPTDQHLRAVADEAGKLLGQSITIENRAGANGTGGAAAMPRATPDGYSLTIVPSTIFREPHINKVNYDPAASFTYIMLMSNYTFGWAVKADAPWKTWADFAADALKRPGKINAGASGAVGTPRIGLEEAAEAARIELNVVPYKGEAELATALLGGHVGAAVLSGVAVPHVEGHRMRYLAMMTDTRAKRFPDLPTLRELGVDVVVDSAYGLVGPAGMDADRVRVVHDAFKKALESPASVKVMDQLNQQMN